MNFNNQSVGNQNKFHCNVCKINFSTEGEYALHEFSKKHCDNLLKISKSILNKSKAKEVKLESSLVNKEEAKVNVDTTQGNFARYGHFIFGETYTVNSESKELNTECHSSLQKHAENPLKEVPVTPKKELEKKSSLLFAPVPFISKTNFKKKKEYIRTCQICNVTLLTISEYENHLKSSEHSHGLKMTGMGVSAQFVRASSDLHTTEMNENLTSSEQNEQNYCEKMVAVENSTVFPKIYCDICELSLNSKQQYNAHINGKPHNNLAKKKAEVKDSKSNLKNSDFKQLYCYTCKLLLNNLSQYNDHKNGKKHKMKCRKLMRKGITIPPEEMADSLKLPELDLNKPVIYTKMYQKSVPEVKAVNNRIDANELKMNVNNDRICADNMYNTSYLKIVETQANPEPKNFFCKICNLNFVDAFSLEIHVKNHDHQKFKELNSQDCEQRFVDKYDFCENKSQFELGNLKKTDENVLENSSGIAFHADKICSNTSGQGLIHLEIQKSVEQKKGSISVAKEGSNLEFSDNLVKTSEAIYGNLISTNQCEEKNILNMGESFKCTLCCENFMELSDFEYHLSGEEHAKKIQESKNIGIKADDIVQILLKDKTLVKPDKLGRHTCSLCSFTTENATEFIQHQSSIFHQSSEEDFKKKTSIEIKYSVNINHMGQFFCKVCQEGYANLVNYNKHLHTFKHRDNVELKVDGAQTKDKDQLSRHKRLIQMYTSSGPKRKDFNWWRRKWEKNPGMRAKILATAKDLQANHRAGIPCLETKTGHNRDGQGDEKNECKRAKMTDGVKSKRLGGRLKHYGAKHAKNPKEPHLSIRHSVNSHPGGLKSCAPLPPHVVQYSRYSQPQDCPWIRDSNSRHFGYWQPRFISG